MLQTPLKRMVAAAAALAGCTLLAASPALATPLTFDGITFQNGAASFADEVLSYNPAGSGVFGPYANPNEALGTPNYASNPYSGFASLGTTGGVLELQFTNNVLTTSGDSADDLYVFEVGPAVEAMDVFISQNGTQWISTGHIAGATAGIDIDAYVSGGTYSYVRLVATNQSSSNDGYAGPDIDAVGAISSVSTVPEPGALALLALGLLSVGLVGRRRSV